MPGVLDGIRIVDLSTGATGGIATMVLADFGADVVKVEPPGGDPFRIQAASRQWLRGKRSVTLDLTGEDGRAALLGLFRGADAVVSSLSDAQAREMGCDYEALAAGDPRLIYCHVSGFGPTGPLAGYPAYEGVVQARGGRMLAFEGTAPRSGPQFTAVHVATHTTSQAAASGVLAALLARDRTGRGQRVDVSMLQGLTTYDLAGLSTASLLARYPERWTGLLEAVPAAGRVPTINYQPVMAGDGQWIQLGNLLQHLFDNFCTAAELFEIYTEPRYEGSPATWAAEDREAFRDRMFERMREKTAAEWHQIFSDQGGVVSTTYQTTQQALDDPDLVLNGHVLELPDPASPSGMTMKTIGPVARLTQTPAAVRATAPSPGEHTASVLAESAASASGAATGRDASARPTLDGVLVLDFSTIIAGPLGCSHLADLGARVIKVEQIGGDPYRWMGPGGLGPIRTNQGKESISVDLKTEEGRAIVQALVAKADLLVHNYRPGVTERLGVGYGDASRLNPGIVYVNVNGYGPDGPSSHRPATHPIPGAALGGATWQAGGMPTGTSLDEIREGARRLFRANEVNPDPNTSAVVTTAALLGLVARRRHGIGQEIFVDMLGANAYANGDDFFWYEGRTPRGEIDAELLGTGPLYRLYRASEGWMFLGLLLDDEWRRFCSLTGRTDLASDARFATAVARDEHAAALTEVLEGLFTTQTAEEWESLLAPQGVGCVRADEGLPGAFWYTSDHIAANGMMETVTHGRHGALERHAPIIRTRGTPNRVASAPLAGEQTDAILDELGYTSEDIARLHTAGVVWHEDDLPGRQ